MRKLLRLGEPGDADRTAVFLDAENLLYPFWVEGALGCGLIEIGALLDEARATGDLVLAEAVCHHHLCQEAGIGLDLLGVRVFRHLGGLDAADIQLSRRMAVDRPSSCLKIVLGSGDGYFVEAVRALQAVGVTVNVVAVEGHLSRDLAVQADSVRLIRLSSLARRVA